MVKLFIPLKDNENTKESFIPYTLLIAIIFVGLVINATHVFVYTFSIDPTYIFVVSFAYYLYWIVFTKDFKVRLLRNSRNELINEMQEIYIIAEMHGDVYEYSNKLNAYFNLDDSIVKDLDSMMTFISKKAVLFNDYDKVKDEPYQEKRYLYTVQKDFRIPGFERHGVLILLYDETRHIKLVNQLNYGVKYDSMTNLFNQNHFDKLYDTFESDHDKAGVIITDINGLKLYNDYLGHRAGDALIVEYAAILKTFESDRIQVYRFGGDEFLFYIENTDLKTLKRTVSELREMVLKTVFPKKVSIRTGVALRRKNESLSNLINRADNALYREKNVYSP